MIIYAFIALLFAIVFEKLVSNLQKKRGNNISADLISAKYKVTLYEPLGGINKMFGRTALVMADCQITGLLFRGLYRLLLY